jgi:chemotaxis protein histidine kinase CheA
MTADAFRRQLDAISAEYRRGLPEKLARIESLWDEIAGGKAGPARVGELVSELHSIAGSARTFGIAGVSEAAGAAESFLEPIGKGRERPSAAQQVEFARLLDALNRAAAPATS